MLTADSNKKFVLCITDAFTKYAVVTAIANKEAETVADAIYRDWFAKFGILINSLYSTGADGADGTAAQADDHTIEDGGQQSKSFGNWSLF